MQRGPSATDSGADPANRPAGGFHSGTNPRARQRAQEANRFGRYLQSEPQGASRDPWRGRAPGPAGEVQCSSHEAEGWSPHPRAIPSGGESRGRKVRCGRSLSGTAAKMGARLVAVGVWALGGMGGDTKKDVRPIGNGAVVEE